MEVKKINWFFPVLVISYLFLNVVSGVVIGIMMAAGINIPMWILYVLGEAIALLIALVYILIMRINIMKDMPYKLIGIKDILLSVLTGYLLIPMVLFLNNITMLFSNNYLNESSQELIAYPYLVQVILMAVIPPLVEEFVFRGLFYGTYRKYNVPRAAVMSGLIFGIFHLNINQFAYAFVIGIIFAYMVEATGSVWASVCAHFAVNTYSITVIQILKMSGSYDSVISSSAEQQLTDIPVVSQVISYIVMFIVAVVFMMLAILCIRNMAKRHGRLQYIKLRHESEDVFEDDTSYAPTDSQTYLQENNQYINTDTDSSVTECKTVRNRIMTAPAAVTIVVCMVYMIVMEVVR